MHKKTKARATFLDNGVRLGRVAYTQWGGLRARFGIVEEIRGGWFDWHHNVILSPIDDNDGRQIYEYGSNLRNLSRKRYEQRKAELQEQLDLLERAWETQQQLEEFDGGDS
jgi:hypothetical protein